MSEYEPQVGDRVDWAGDKGAVLATHEESVWVLLDRGYAATARVVDLVKLPTFPERWINVYPNGVASEWFSREIADERNGRDDRLGVIHLHADGSLTMEAP